MKDLVVIKALNSLGSNFETYITIVNNKAREEEKLPELETLLKNLEEEENRNKLANLNFTRHNSDTTRGGRSPRGGRGGHGDRGGRNSFSSNAKGDKDESGVPKDCRYCGTKHVLGKKHCPDKDVTCDNCNRKGHKKKRCIREGGNMHRKEVNSVQTDEGAQTPQQHIGHIQAPKDLTYTEEVEDISPTSEPLHIHIGNLKVGAHKAEIRLNKMYVHTVGYGVWILDSGATHHCTGNKALFSKLKPVNEVANTASGEKLAVEGVGIIPVHLPNGHELHLTNAMFIPSLTVSLISTACLWRKGISITYPAGYAANLYNKESLFGYADYHQGLFILRSHQVLLNKVITCLPLTPSAHTSIENLESEAFINVFRKPTSSLEVWHRRLAHSSYRNVIANAKKVKGMDGVKGPTPDHLCEPCMKGRQQKEPSRVPMTKPKRFLEGISVDIGGPLPTTWRGNKIFVLLKCEATGMLFWYACKHKSEIFHIVVDFRTWAELQTGLKILYFRGGGELNTGAFLGFYKETGVQYKQSAPYTAEQNSFIERAMYTVMAPVRSIMKDMHLPKTLWDLLGEAVCYTKNRTLTYSGSTPGITPYEAGNKAIPDISNLRALGCRAYTHVPKTTQRHKLDDRSWKGIHVGYGGNNQWKIFNPRTGKVHLTRDVRFDENYSYYDSDLNAPEDAEVTNEEDLNIGDGWNDEDDELFLQPHRHHAPEGAEGAVAHTPPTPESIPIQ